MTGGHVGRNGPSPNPTALRILRGDPKRRINSDEPQPFSEPLSKPDWLSPYASHEWDRVADDLVHMKIAKRVDSATLAAYCESVSRFRRATEIVEKSGPLLVGKTGDVRKNPAVAQARDASGDMLRWAREFGFTPSARQPLRVHHSGSIEAPTTLQQLLGS